MSDLRPEGIPVEIDGVERHLLFTLNAIDALQDMYDEPIEEIIDHLTEKPNANTAMRRIISTLLNDEAERVPEKGYKTYTEREAGWIVNQQNVIEYTINILRAYGLSLPKADEDEIPNQESGNVKE